jgi:hypothetical protein
MLRQMAASAKTALAFDHFSATFSGSRLEKIRREILFYGYSKRPSPRHGDQLQR